MRHRSLRVVTAVCDRGSWALLSRPQPRLTSLFDWVRLPASSIPSLAAFEAVGMFGLVRRARVGRGCGCGAAHRPSPATGCGSDAAGSQSSAPSAGSRSRQWTLISRSVRTRSATGGYGNGRLARFLSLWQPRSQGSQWQKVTGQSDNFCQLECRAEPDARALPPPLGRGRITCLYSLAL